MSEPKNYRKKPVEISAWRLPVWGEPNNPGAERPSEENPVFDVIKYVDECIAIAEWCGGTSHMMVNEDELAYSASHHIGPHISIPTLEGVMAARPDDYVIKGVQGEFYPCKPDIFYATYVSVSA